MQLFSHISEVMFDQSYLMNFDHFERCLSQPIAKFVQNKCVILVKDSNQVLKNKFWMICHQFPNRRWASTAAQKMGVCSRDNIMVCNSLICWLWILSNCTHQNLTGPRFDAAILDSFVRYWIFSRKSEIIVSGNPTSGSSFRFLVLAHRFHND